MSVAQTACSADCLCAARQASEVTCQALHVRAQVEPLGARVVEAPRHANTRWPYQLAPDPCRPNAGRQGGCERTRWWLKALPPTNLDHPRT